MSEQPENADRSDSTVTLTPLQAEDFERVAGWLSDAAINRWLETSWQGGTFTDKHIAVLGRTPSSRLFIVHHDGSPAGLAALSEIDRADATANVWYLISPDQQGKGLATAAVRAVVDKAFNEMGLATLTAWVTAGNEASCRLLERVGFAPAGILRRGSCLDGERADRRLFDILPEDFAAAGGEKPG